MTIGPTGEVVLIGERVTLTAVARDAKGNPLAGKPITWTTSDAAIATVSGGVVTALAGGPVMSQGILAETV